MRDYASLLGDERAEQEVMRIEERFYDLNASPVLHQPGETRRVG
jgi:hypothetical protein